MAPDRAVGSVPGPKRRWSPGRPRRTGRPRAPFVRTFSKSPNKKTAKAPSTPRRVGGERQPFPESEAGETTNSCKSRIAAKGHQLSLWVLVVSFFRLVNGDKVNNPEFLCFGRHFSWRPCFLAPWRTWRFKNDFEVLGPLLYGFLRASSRQGIGGRLFDRVMLTPGDHDSSLWAREYFRPSNSMCAFRLDHVAVGIVGGWLRFPKPMGDVSFDAAQPVGRDAESLLERRPQADAPNGTGLAPP